MRRVFDLLLIVAFLAAVGLGAYELGHRVDRLSNQAASQDSELSQPTTTTASAHRSKSHRTPIIVVGALGGTVAVLVLVSVARSLMRSTRRERWRAT